jgi:hypothetical protein
VKSDTHHLDDNTGRLIRAALGDKARPSPELRLQTFELLIRRRHPQLQPFPDPVLALLGSLVIFATLYWIGSSLTLSSTASAFASLQFIRFVGVLNLIVLPFAGIVIIIRRKRYV